MYQENRHKKALPERSGAARRGSRRRERVVGPSCPARGRARRGRARRERGGPWADARSRGAGLGRGSGARAIRSAGRDRGRRSLCSPARWGEGEPVFAVRNRTRARRRGPKRRSGHERTAVGRRHRSSPRRPHPASAACEVARDVEQVFPPPAGSSDAGATPVAAGSRAGPAGAVRSRGLVKWIADGNHPAASRVACGFDGNGPRDDGRVRSPDARPGAGGSWSASVYMKSAAPAFERVVLARAAVTRTRARRGAPQERRVAVDRSRCR